MKRESFITIRLTKQEKKLIEEEAKKEARNVSNFLLWCWKEGRKKKRGENDKKTRAST